MAANHRQAGAKNLAPETVSFYSDPQCLIILPRHIGSHPRNSQTAKQRRSKDKSRTYAKASPARAKAKQEQEQGQKRMSRNGGARNTSLDHADTWTDADWWSSGAQICGLILHGASGKTVATDAAGSRTVQSNTRRKHFKLGRLTMCELSVDDGEQ